MVSFNYYSVLSLISLISLHWSAGALSVNMNTQGETHTTSSTSMERRGKSLKEAPMHLGLNATTSSLTKITGGEWYEKYGKDTKSDGNEGRLVSMHTFSEPWNVWEMHPVGEESVICTSGEIILIQELHDGTIAKTLLKAGEYAVNPKGVWHIATRHAPQSSSLQDAGRNTKRAKY